MKKFVTLLFLLISFIGLGQEVIAPDSKSFLQSINGQDASGFVLSGFIDTDILLTSISLLNPPIGTTFYLNTITGLTPASGFTLVGNKTRLVVIGKMSDINNALASLKVNTGIVKGNVQLSVAATINPTGFYYNGVNGHFYKPVTTGATYKNARATSLTTSFKGQTGYLLTLTSANEEDFIKLNVPQSNIWFAATDEVIDGTWVIDAGPEKGTIMKTSNGQTAGNKPGVYNNWCGGEPNGGNHSEDYPVAKWNGAACWNDLSNGYNNPYVIEYGTWSNPDDQTFTDFYNNSVTHTNGEMLTAKFNINFGTNMDETKFSTKAYTYTNNMWNATTNSLKSISGLGKTDISSDLDTLKVQTGGYKGTISGGQVEWSYVDFSNGVTTLYIDLRVFGAVGGNSLTHIKLLDVYEGPVTFLGNDVYWCRYIIPSTLPIITNGTTANSQYIRDGGGYYSFACDITFALNYSYKQHGIELNANSQIELNTLYSNIVSVSDVYLAFKELSNNGLFANESGNEFVSGLQYMNADVDGNGSFNEEDTYKLLQHLTGVKSLTQYSALTYLMKLYDKVDYDNITKSNWANQFNNTRNLIPFNLNQLNNTYNLNVTWVGDVNLSHSASQTQSNVTTNNVKSMSLNSMSISNEINTSILTEIVGDSVYAYITIYPLQQELVGTQFKLNYDNSLLKFNNVVFKTKGSPTNYGTDRGDYVNFGSLITDGGILDNTTEYKISFTSKTKLSNILGLISVGFTDAVNKNGTPLKVRMK